MKNLKIVFLIICIFGALTNYSCSKSDKVLNIDNEKTKFIELDLSFYTNENTHDSNSKIAKAELSKSKISSDHITSGLYATVETKISDYREVKSDPKGEIVKKANTRPGATGNSPEGVRIRLESGVGVKVLVFDGQDRFLGSSTAIVGQKTKIPVRPRDVENINNETYRMVAFSYNTKTITDLPVFPDTYESGDNPQLSIELPTDKEFLYYNGTLAPQTGIHNLVLRPKTTKVSTTVNAKSLGAKIKKVKGAFSDFSYKKTANFDLKFNQVVGSTDGIDVNIPLAFDIEVPTGSEQDTLNIARYFYVKDLAQPIQDKFEVTFSEIHLLEDEIVNNVLSSNYVKNFGSVVLKSGLHYNQTFNLIRAFEVGNVLWSYGNLYYDVNDPLYKYKIRRSPGDGKEFMESDYWLSRDNSYHLLPTSTSSSLGDPCSLVYPQNTWRMPNEGDAKRLLTDSLRHFQDLGRRFDATDGAKSYVEYVNSKNQILRFYAHSFYTHNSSLNTNSYINSDITASFYLWSFTEQLGVISSDPQALVFTISDTTPLISTGQNGVNTDAITNYDDDGLAAYPKMNIRCVRDK